ncbi:GntT/GntP/DsdX family permease [Hirschia baltica]|uniref:Gluconate transporter n=1 Tax=Hirschia baltica (strain ATCC 49814 / DSM 5838 / IFAM 1418) TaxID=582402 RepID=C6XID8_HIRBI|nr:gluconate:H+ symporter [Hirschia baltica]ACT60745.1 gluconate transporter [Hirschia baltica ATCC 49814]
MFSAPILFTIIAIATLLFLVLKVKLPAFIALLMVSLGFGLCVGMTPDNVIEAVKSGMGGTLGFVAIVVGLGAMMGVLLEQSGGVQAISTTVLKRFGADRSQYALGLIGFIVAIPVFFDIAFIILMPVLMGLQKSTKKPLVFYAIPLLAGLAATHAFIPPTPGPIAVADILNADLGWVIAFGAIAGLPATLIAGPIFAKKLAKMKEFLTPEGLFDTSPDTPIEEIKNPIGFMAAISTILIPLALILVSTLTKMSIDNTQETPLYIEVILFTGHPFIALLIACLFSWYFIGIRRGVDAPTLNTAMVKALEPAGIIVLVTGAGGVFKQMLVSSGAGADVAALLQANALPIVCFAFVIAVIVRVAQGSSTVAMITAAGLTAPVAETIGIQGPQLALLVIAIASGASVLSHVNDSGFWLVSRYLKFSEAQTLKSWTASTTILGGTAFLIVCSLWLIT